MELVQMSLFDEFSLGKYWQEGEVYSCHMYDKGEKTGHMELMLLGRHVDASLFVGTDEWGFRFYVLRDSLILAMLPPISVLNIPRSISGSFWDAGRWDDDEIAGSELYNVLQDFGGFHVHEC